MIAMNSNRVSQNASGITGSTIALLVLAVVATIFYARPWFTGRGFGLIGDILLGILVCSCLVVLATRLQTAR